MSEEKVFDATGKELNEGDRVWCYDFFGDVQYGILHKNEYTNVSEWAVLYDDGEDCAVLNLNDLYKEEKDI